MNIEDMEGLGEETLNEIKALQKVTREKDGNEAFAEAQATIGEFLIKKKKPEKAIEAWSKVKRSDNSNLYAKLQINIGIAFRECGNIKNALKSWRNVTRLDDQEVYAHAQFYIGLALKENGDDREAIEAWNNIKHTDHLELYAKAKLNIGLAFIEQQDNENAVIAWENIKHSDNPALYASAQINIGNVLKKNQDNQGALQAFYNVKREGDPIAFAHAQFNIGAILQELGDNNKAIEIWEKIIPLDDPEVHAKAQLNIGITSYNNGDKEFALATLESINHADNSNAYAKAQYVIAKILKERNNYGDALKALCSIEQSDDPETYAHAELFINSLLDEVGNHTSSLEALSRIKHQDSSAAYSLAQWLIGSDFERNGNIDEAIKRWSNINYLDNPQVYAFSQYQTGLLLIRDHISKKYKDAEQAFTNSESTYPYESYCYRKICELLTTPETNNFGLISLNLLDTVLNIVNILTLDFDSHADEEKPFERKLAHYTSTYTCNLLLGNEQKEIAPSLFRLNTINNVNDPSEGKLLTNYLEAKKETSFYKPDFDERLHAFISCFTFNHDSLNQFRLYGKEDNKEASGISLVFNKEFFKESDAQHSMDNIYVDRKIKEIKDESEGDKDNNLSGTVEKQSVMRCVYIDPTSDYIHLAQRNRLTFFREFGRENLEGDSISRAEIECTEYENYIDEKTEEFRKAFKELKEIYQAAIENKQSLKSLSKEDINEIDSLLDMIILPLKYLIKHSAFQEEQECRMVYITSLKDERVQMDFGKFLYVEYEPEVKANLDKIYIAPAATQYQPYLAKLLCDTDVKIELSNNPYRQT